MRTKEEITKKKSFSLDEVEVEKDTSIDQLKKKRVFIALGIFFTIGLSLIFVVYRQVRVFIANPKINVPSLPHLELPKDYAIISKKSDLLTPLIAKTLSENPEKWNLVISKKSYIYNWPNNHSVLNEVQINNLVKNFQSNNTGHQYSQYLPLGLDIKQRLISSESHQQLTLLITPPDTNIFIDIEFQGPEKTFQSSLAILLPDIYWQLMTTNNF